MSTPEQSVDELFRAFDSLDVAAIEPLFDDDAQGVDELSGGWRRGTEALRAYLSELTSGALTDVRSTITDLHTNEWHDTAVVTLVLHQSYVLEGEPRAIHAPTSIVLRRRDDRWLVALVHSVPLADVSEG